NIIDHDEGLKQYLTTFSVETNEATFDVSIRHRQLANDNSIYRGKLWLSANGDFGKQCQGQTCEHALLSVTYDKVSADETRIDYRYKTTSENDANDWFTTQKDVSPETTTGYYWGLSAINPETGAGRVAFA